MSGTIPASTSLAIVAGGGAMPRLVADDVAARGVRVFAVRLAGHAERDTLEAYEGMWARPEHMGRVFAALRAQGIRDIVLIGRMRRPKWWELRPDLTTLALLPRILPALLFGGDDALLRAVRRALEAHGFALRGVHELVAAFLAPAGVMGRHAPDDVQLTDIALGLAAARAHGLADAGQAVVVRDGAVMDREDAEGTDALIRRNAVRGAVLVKTAKPQQDRSLDLPAIGPETIRNCIAAGFAGIAVEAGATLVAEKKQVIDLADAHGLFLIGTS